MKYRIVQQHDLIWIEQYIDIGIFWTQFSWKALGSWCGSGRQGRWERITYSTVEAAECEFKRLVDNYTTQTTRQNAEIKILKVY